MTLPRPAMILWLTGTGHVLKSVFRDSSYPELPARVQKPWTRPWIPPFVVGWKIGEEYWRPMGELPVVWGLKSPMGAGVVVDEEDEE